MAKRNIFDDYDNIGTKSYKCPHCGAFAGMECAYYQIRKQYGRSELEFLSENKILMDGIDTRQLFEIATCGACNKIQFWLGEKMIYPVSSTIEEPNQDMPEEVKDLYNEARSVFKLSPKAGAALLRLGLQKLCKYLGGKGENINEDIGWLVKQGLPPKIQEAFDSIRVIGNNGVHPGEINLDENKDLAAALFPLMNLIVEKMISDPKKIDEIYKCLPPRALEAIGKRDKV